MQTCFAECTCGPHACVLACFCVCHCTRVGVCMCMRVYPCACVGRCAHHSCGCPWAYMSRSAFVSMLLCAPVTVCVRVSGCWHVRYRVSVSVRAHHCARVLVCLSACVASPMCCCVSAPPLVLPPLTAAGPAGDSPRAPLTAVFYHHLPRKGAQEDGDK